MDLSLPSPLEEIIKGKIASGKYYSVGEVLREALHLLEERDHMEMLKFQALRKDIIVAVEELDQGKGSPLNIEEIIQRGKERLRQQSEKK